MIKLQRIQAQGTQDFVMTDNMSLKLRPGESLLLDHSGVKTLRVGLDLVMLLPTGEYDATGKPVVLRLVVTEFFSQSANTQVVVTSADEPVQMITPDSAGLTDVALDAQAANGNNDIEALQEVQNQTALMEQALVETQSTSFEMQALLATNSSVEVNWQKIQTKMPDMQILAKLQSVNAPQPPELFPLNSSLTYPKNGGLLALNKAMAVRGFVVQGMADANSSVTLLLTYADTSNTTTIQAKVDGSGKFTAQLPFKLLSELPSGVFNITAVSTDTLQAVSPPSNSQSLYIDVKPPEKVVFDWNASSINLNAGFINQAKAQSDLVFKGKAEANSLIKFSVMNKAGLTNPGDGSYTTQADENGNWQWTLTPDMAALLSIAGNSKTQYLNIQATATDDLDNESIATVFNSVGLDLTPPDVPELSIDLTDSVQSNGQSYKTLSKKSLDQSTVFTGKNFLETNGKINLKLVKQGGGETKEFENIAVASDGTWSRKFSAGELNSLTQGEYQVFVRGVDEADNKSEWSSPQTIWLDVEPPSAPTIGTLPTGNFSIVIDGNSLKVVNIAALSDTQKKFSGAAEAGSTVYLTLYNTANAAREIKKSVLTKPDGTWEIQLTRDEWSELSEGVVAFSAAAKDLSGNPSSVSEKDYLYLDTVAPVDPTVQFSDVVMARTASVNGSEIRFINRDDLQNGTLISGTAEKGSTVTLKINGRTVADNITVRDDGTWRYNLVNSQTNDWTSLFAEGTLSVKVIATDIARNSSNEVTYNGLPVEKHTARPDAPQGLKLLQGDDTGSSDPATLTDNKTNKPAPKLQWNIGTGLKTYIWADTDKDGELDASEKNPNAVDTSYIANQTDVTFQVTMTSQGPQKYFVVTQDVWGNFSEPQDITIVLDTTVTNPEFDGFDGDSNLSLEEFRDRAKIILSGTTDEDGCVVSIALFDSTGTHQLNSWVEVRAVDKKWSTANFFTTLPLGQNGSFILRIFNTDEVGNSTQSRPLDIPMNIRTTALNDVSVVRLSADTDTGNSRPNTNSDNITNNTSPVLTGQVRPDPDAELIVRLYDSEGKQLVPDADSPSIGPPDGSFSFQLKPEWLKEGEAVKFILKTYDKKTGTLSEVTKDIDITLDTSYDESKFTIDNVTPDNVINYNEFNSSITSDRPIIQGTAEVNSEITIKLSKTVGSSVITETIPSSQITYTTGSDGKYYWSTPFTERMGNTLGDGRIDVEITAIDRANNHSQTHVSYFDLKRGQLTAPQMLKLNTADDTGVSTSDNITRGQDAPGSTKRAVTLKGNTNTTANVEVTIFDDKNKNGVFDDDDVKLETFSQSGTEFAKTYELEDGEYNFVNSIKDLGSGQSSSTSDRLTVIIDSKIEKPTVTAMGTNGLINALVYENPPFQITGTGEPNATVYLQFKLKSDLSRELLSPPWTVQVDSEGKWRLNVTKAQMDALTEGELIGYVSQKDKSDNVSGTVEVGLMFDKTPPAAPSQTSIDTVLDNYYISNSLSKPWDRGGEGIKWTDIYDYDSTTRTQTAKFLTLAIALPSSGSASSVKSGDTVTLRWRQQALDPVEVTAQDVTNGYVLVKVSGQTIDAQGKSDNLDVMAFFTDKSDNKSAEFKVLSGIKVSLALKSPSLDLSENSQKNLGDLSGQDKTWYSNKISTFKIKGVAEPGATVMVYAKREDGTGSELVLTPIPIQADRITGVYEKVVDLSGLGLSANVKYALQSQSSVGGISSVRSDAEYLNVNSLPMSPPLLDMSTLGGDGYVNNLERNAGVPISGSRAPAYAKIQIKLTNINTGVDHYVTPFYAAQNGTWSYTLGITDWGVVGEGKISVAVKQTNIYGDESSFTMLTNDVIFDATVAEPLLDIVSGDNYINLSEYNDSRLNIIQISGKAEARSKLSVTLTGANGYVYTPGTQPVVRDDGTWVLNLTQSILQALGPGKVTVALSQEDLAKNTSQTSKNTFFTIDLSSDDLTLNSVTSDNIVNDVEKDQGVTLSGNAEAGSWVQITLKQSGVADKVLPGFKVTGSTWVYALKKEILASYSDGTVMVSITQTDVSGNPDTKTGSFTLLSAALQSPTVTTWNSSPVISLAEQSSNYTINGTGPANSELNIQFVKADGSRVNLPSVSIGANGLWQIQLTPAQMAGLQGDTTLRYWATKADQSTAIQELSLRIDSNFPSPSLDEVGGDGSISLSDFSNGGELEISGDGEKYSTVTVRFRGNNNSSIPDKEAVVDNQTGAWSVKLTRQELEDLTNNAGKVFLTLVQKDNNSDRKSVAISKSFDVDMLAPPLPTISEQADARNFNTVVSGNNYSVAADGTVSDIDAKAGVSIAVPVAKVGGNFVLSSGDSLSIQWGDQVFTKLLTTSDFPVGTNYIVVKVPLDVIAKAGEQNNMTVAVVYTDKFGNSSQPLTLISNLVVTPPPPAPSIDTISEDGFVNLAELVALNSNSNGLEIKGQSLQTSGRVSLVFTKAQDASNPIKTINDIVVGSNGKWSTYLSAELLKNWVDGQYFVFATYTVNGRTSVVTKSVFEIDRVKPDSPLEASKLAANDANSVSELSGGIIRPRINGRGPNSAEADRYDPALVTEAAKDVNVRVALHANAKIGDYVVLTWGDNPPPGKANTVTQAVSNADISRGYMTVRVSSLLIAELGDFTGSNKLTIKAQFFDNAKNPGEEFKVIEGLVVDAVPLPIKVVSSNFGDWLNLKTAQLGWKFFGECDAGAEIEITMVGSSGFKTQPIRFWKDASGVIQTNGGQWTVSDGLNLALARQLGEGLVFVSIVQRDKDGNPSAAYESSFRIDLTAPVAPTIDTISKLTYSKYAEGKTITGELEKNAVVTVCYEVLNQAGQVVFTSDKKSATINGNTWSDTLSKDAFNDFLTELSRLSPGTTGGKVRVKVYQTDLAKNDSVESIQEFSFESAPLTVPSVSAVTGLDLSSTTPDAVVISQSDLSGRTAITVAGSTTYAGSQIHLVLQKINGSSKSWDIQLPSGETAWSKDIPISDLYGDGQYVLTLSTRVLDAYGNLENESLAKTFEFTNGQKYFTIDTNGPVCQSIEISANGANGNARLGDEVQVVLNFSEFIQVDTTLGSPSIVLTGFSGGGTRIARYVSNNAQTKQMVFSYTVDSGTNAPDGSVSVQSVDWNNAQVTDLYGNPRQGTEPANQAHGVIVDTIAPTYTPVILSVSGTESSSPGGGYIIEAESNNVTVSINISSLSINELGASLVVNWNGADLPAYLIKSEDFTAGYVDLPIDKTVLTGLEADNVSLKVKLLDIAGNPSPEASILINIDTIKPDKLTIDTWMSDNLISVTEYTSLTNITGSGIQPGTSVTAKNLLQRRSPHRVCFRWTVQADGTWFISSSEIATILSTIGYGRIRIASLAKPTRMVMTAIKPLGPIFWIKMFLALPTYVDISGVGDGWLNANEANRVELKIGLNTSGAGSPKANDKLNIQFWKYAYKQVRPVGATADFSLSDVVITDVDIAAGFKVVTLTTSALQTSQQPAGSGN